MTVVTIRLISLAFVWLAVSRLSKEAFQISLVSILYGHYALSFFYAKTHFCRLGRERASWVPLVVLAVLTAAYVASGFHVVALVAFVGFHISLSEIYMLNQAENAHLKLDAATLWHLNLSRFATNASLYVLLLHSHPLFSAIPVAALHVLVAASFAYFLATLARRGGEATKALRPGFFSFEFSGLVTAYVLFALDVPLSFQLFVYYHVITWILYPAISYHRRGDLKSLVWFGTHTVAATAFFFVVTSPALLGSFALDLKSSIPLWATLHFVTSFPLSRLNPVFVTRYFFPEKST